MSRLLRTLKKKNVNKSSLGAVQWYVLIYILDLCVAELSGASETTLAALVVNTFKETTDHQDARYWNYA